MRLDKIKIAGFKSFVDPTTLLFSTNLTGVVGPNGCGKSNVIDAVRWVMGESSAKMLRGESMSDVIFNGSSSRKSVGRATVELIFDNSDHKAGGEYANYATISTKRLVTRDGQSSYYMNGTKCRKRDITDLFLGTGLGPRSYSIIEQGMISRLIEARPEEMRTFIEEAAGISKYKARRKETMRHIQATRENLARVNDLMAQMTKQLSHLSKQAKTAEKYQQLKQQARIKKAELWALQWHKRDQQVVGFDQQIDLNNTALADAIIKQQTFEEKINQLREIEADKNKQVHLIQESFYAANTEISRLEQAIQFNQENQQRHENNLKEIEQRLIQTIELISKNEQDLSAKELEIRLLKPDLEILEAQQDSTNDDLMDAELILQENQQRWDEFQVQYNQPSQQAQLERTKINHLESTQKQLEQRLSRLDKDFNDLSIDNNTQQIEQLTVKIDTESCQIDKNRAVLIELRQQKQQLEQDNQLKTAQLHQHQKQLQSANGRLTALETLQQSALDKTNNNQWLINQNLFDLPRLAEDLIVDEKWQVAVEQILGQHLQALCLNKSLQAADFKDLEAGIFSLLEPASKQSKQILLEDGLIQKINAKWDLTDFFYGVRCIDSLAEAINQRVNLNIAEYFICPDGTMIGRHWLHFNQDKSNQQSGVLARNAEIKALKIKIEELEQQLEVLNMDAQSMRQNYQALDNELTEQQHLIDQQQAVLTKSKAEIAAKMARNEQLKQRLSAINHEQDEIKQQQQQNQAKINAAQIILHQALEQVEYFSQQRLDLEQQRQELKQQVDDLRQQAKMVQQNTYEKTLDIEKAKTNIYHLKQEQSRFEKQQLKLKATQKETLNQLSKIKQPLENTQEQLKINLLKQQDLKQQLDENQSALNGLKTQYEAQQEQRHQAEQALKDIREILDNIRLERQSIMVHRENYATEIEQADYQPLALFEQLPASANIQTWQADLINYENKINRLGAINLAAIDEYKTESAHLSELEAQHLDITTALQMLENAIDKINKETKVLFKETFEKINAGVKVLFPKLFGGGKASLEMMGDDLLSAGVSVMARPPGKRNSSIHQLSGGEKALTAVALVFAIFQLNPAPFCMLDEVDAPLDDANVRRFTKLVKEMSDQVQFIFITHNKITMEISRHLNGITMFEAGVSRLVSVDIEEASQLAMM